jgi:hypothetical protein
LKYPGNFRPGASSVLEAAKIAVKSGEIMRFVKVILHVAAAIVAFCAAAFVALGLLIPSERNFSNEVEINAPAEVVWQVINDRSRYTEWQTSLDHVEIIDDRNWIEHTKGGAGPMTFNLAKDERPTAMEFRYSIENSFLGWWRGEISPVLGGVKLRTQDSYTAKSWPAKIMIYIFFDMDAFAKDWNGRLKERAEKMAAED